MISVAQPAFWRFLRRFALWIVLCFGMATISAPLLAAPHAAHVMDARTGETLFEDNANTSLHPASLTKMLTLYIAFEEIQRGNLTLDSMITVSKNAAAQPPSRLGLKAGQKIQLRFLIRAAAIKSANDAAQAIGDAIGGNQADFAKRMTRTAKSLGMTNSTFKNASGLTAKGHLSTAHDMSVLGRRLFYDFPQYYNIFSRRQTNAGVADVANTNRRFLDAYKGADGIKTGFTQAAGFNLTASAERGNVRIIATVFGGDSTADRNAKVAKLLDRGFALARGDVNEIPPPPPVYENADNELLANAQIDDGMVEGGEGSAAKTVRAIMTVQVSPRPMPRPDYSEIAGEAEELVASMADGIAGALAEATGLAPEQIATADQSPPPLPFAIASAEDVAPPQTGAETLAAETLAAKAEARPAPRPASLLAAPVLAGLSAPFAAPEPAPPIEPALSASLAQPAPETEPQAAAQPAIARNAPIYDDQSILAAATSEVAAPAPSTTTGEVVTRLSTSGGKHWGVNVGRFKSSDAAERVLVKTQLVEGAVLGASLRKVTEKGGGFDANFLGLSQEAAELACRRLIARSIPCLTLGP
jgi:D-alanyl-D-alanine carboxypeptidase